MGFLNEICFLAVLVLWIYAAIRIILAVRRFEKRIDQAIDDLMEDVK